MGDTGDADPEGQHTPSAAPNPEGQHTPSAAPPRSSAPSDHIAASHPPPASGPHSTVPPTSWEFHGQGDPYPYYHGYPAPPKHNYVTKADLNKALHKFAKTTGRKRKRSASSYSESDTQESSYYGSDSESDSYGPGNSDSHNHTNQSVFPYENEIYVLWNPNEHHYIDSTKIRWGGEVRSVKWHPMNNKAFCLLKEPSSDTEFISPQLGHQNIMDSLNLDNRSNIPSTSNRKCFDATFGQDSALFKLLSLIKNKEPEINHLLVADEANNTNKAMDKIPDDLFKCLTTANFSAGWTFSSVSFLDWAKEEQLDVEQATIALELNFPAKVSNSALKEELKARSELVNYLSGLKLIELFSTKLDDNSKASALLAIAQHFLPMLKRLVIEWMASKISVRSQFLNDTKSTASLQLLKSSLWDNKIFPEDAINTLKTRGYQRSIASMIYGAPSSHQDPYNRNKKRRRKEEKASSYKPRRASYRSDYTDSAYNSSYPHKAKYKKDKDTRKYKKSSPRSKKEKSPSDSNTSNKSRKPPKSWAGKNKKK